jgi:hypothetical protein
VEAQHVVSTMRLVDSAAEQDLLEQLLEGSKPALPPAARPLHYLLATPFRYRRRTPAAFGRRTARASGMARRRCTPPAPRWPTGATASSWTAPAWPGASC